MCESVGVDFDTFDFDQENWYWQHTWTTDEENRFKQWLVHEIYNNTKLRKATMHFPIRNFKNIEMAVEMFMLNYGWRVSDYGKNKG